MFLITNLKTRAIIGYILKINTYYEQFQHTNALVTDDLIYKLYQILFDELHIPKIIHSDSNITYVSTPIQKLCNEYNVQLSTTQSISKNNQVIEAINLEIKKKVTEISINLSRTLHSRRFYASLPSNCKNKHKKTRIQSVEFRNYLFQHIYFKKQIDLNDIIAKAIKIYNNKKITDFYFKSSHLTRKHYEIINSHIVTTTMHQAKKGSIQSAMIEKLNADSANEVKKTIYLINNDKSLTQDKKKDKINSLKIEQKDIDLEAIKDVFPQIENDVVIKLANFIFANTQVLSDQNLLIYNQNNTLLNQVDQLKSENSELKNILLELKEFKDKTQKKKKKKKLEDKND